MRRPLFAGNWKMNMGIADACALARALMPLVAGAECDIAICPPYTALDAVGREIAGSNVSLGAQNIHWAEKGAFTGEISPAMLKELGVRYAIIGHSERRQYFGENDDAVNKRAKAALQAGITPVVCVGESLEQRESGETDSVVTSETLSALAGIPEEDITKLVIAYEPIWAIGTGRTATSKQADETIGVIRAAVKSIYGESVSSRVRILYGGSMNPKNAAELMKMPNIDGGLIGGASLKAQDFAEVIRFAK